MVIIGGIRWIAAVAGRIVPLMAVIYIVAGIIVIGYYQAIPGALSTIIAMALYGSGIGALMGALLMGVQRATFSVKRGWILGHCALRGKNQ